MEQHKKGESNFQSDRLADCLLAQARLCEKIAGSCSDEESAHKYRRLAQECREGAALEKASSGETVIKAEWPVVIAF